jgi:hypothetical protein
VVFIQRQNYVQVSVANCHYFGSNFVSLRMILFVVSLIVIGVVLIIGWTKLINMIFNPFIKRSEKKQIQTDNIDNPYIEAHLVRRRNDDDYEEYLKWLSDSGGDLPINKILTREEWEFKQQLDNAL